MRVGGDAGAGEVVVLQDRRGAGGHASSVVLPFLLPDTPVVTWWPGEAPQIPAQDPLGRLAIRRITDATGTENPLATLRSRLTGYTKGDTDLAWSRITYWRALLASALDQPPYEPLTGALVSAKPANRRWTSWPAGWRHASDGPVRRRPGRWKVELEQQSQTIVLSRPQNGATATPEPDRAPTPSFRWRAGETRECLAEDLRRLDADEIYHEALAGIDKVIYPAAGN